MSEKAMVTNRGAVLLGNSVACDAFEDTRPLRVVTHAHADHLVGLKRSLRNCEAVLMTAATRDLIGILIVFNVGHKGSTQRNIYITGV